MNQCEPLLIFGFEHLHRRETDFQEILIVFAIKIEQIDQIPIGALDVGLIAGYLLAGFLNF